MKIERVDGIYYATATVKGKVYMGYSPIRKEAIEFCVGLVWS